MPFLLCLYSFIIQYSCSDFNKLFQFYLSELPIKKNIFFDKNIKQEVINVFIVRYLS